jgi:hypothetical protein
MKYTESDYVNIGARYERATPERSRAIAEKIRFMLDQEHPHDRPLARKLIDQGRAEVR